MAKVIISWCNTQTVCGRIVLDENLNEAPEIRRLAETLGIPVVAGQTPLQANDLWVGISPSGGWGELASETMWARSIEAEIVIHCLQHATSAS